MNDQVLANKMQAEIYQWSFGCNSVTKQPSSVIEALGSTPSNTKKKRTDMSKMGSCKIVGTPWNSGVMSRGKASIL